MTTWKTWGFALAGACALAVVDARAEDWDHRKLQSHYGGVQPREVTPEPGEQRVGRVIVAPVKPSPSEVPEALANPSQRQWTQGALGGRGKTAGAASKSDSGIGEGGGRHKGRPPGSHGAPKGSAPGGRSSGM